ncbi:MAG: hypothetical protein ACJAZS_000651 [Alteromonas naphthalenivorans]|jgi:hypothetical protein
MNKTLVFISLLCLATQTYTSDAKRARLEPITGPQTDAQKEFVEQAGQRIKYIAALCTTLNKPKTETVEIDREKYKKTIATHIIELKKIGMSITQIQILTSRYCDNMQYFDCIVTSLSQPQPQQPEQLEFCAYHDIIARIAVNCNDINLWRKAGKKSDEEKQIDEKIKLVLKTTMFLYRKGEPGAQIKDDVASYSCLLGDDSNMLTRLVRIHREKTDPKKNMQNSISL